MTKTQWSRREDQALYQLVQAKGTKQWFEIAVELNEKIGVNRNGKQCRERWYNFVNPDINREPFSPSEDI